MKLKQNNIGSLVKLEFSDSK